MSFYKDYCLYISNELKKNEIFSEKYLISLNERIKMGVMTTNEVWELHNDLYKVELGEDLPKFKTWERKEKIRLLKDI